VTYKEKKLLYYSVTAKDKPMTELLLRYGASVEFYCWVSTHIRTFLYYTAENSSIEIFKMILSRENDNSVKEDALCYAIIDQNVEIVKILLQTGVDVHKGYEWLGRDYPLICLAVDRKYYSADIIKLLFEHSTDKEIHEAFTFILDRNNPELIDIYIECGFNINTDKDALRYAVEYGHNVTAEALINKGFNVNTCDKGACSPLYYAVRRQNIRIIELLLKKGADPALLMGNGKSVLESMDEIRTYWKDRILDNRLGWKDEYIKDENIQIIIDMLAVTPK